MKPALWFWSERACCKCHRPIFECMGFVLARDFLAAMDNKISWYSVREHCGTCVNIIDEKYFRDLPDLTK